jgi:hypothetical protein
VSVDGFLSFASTDWEEVAPLHARLAPLGIDLWVAKERREASTAWHDAVRDAIDRSPAVVLAVSSRWVRSPPCAYELGVARGLRRRVLALLDLSAAMTAPVLPSILHAPDVERIGAERSIDRAVELIAERLRPAGRTDMR